MNSIIARCGICGKQQEVENVYQAVAFLCKECNQESLSKDIVEKNEHIKNEFKNIMGMTPTKFVRDYKGTYVKVIDVVASNIKEKK